MSKPNDDSDIMRRSMKKMFFWLGVSIAISLGVSFGFGALFGEGGFIYSIFVTIAIFVFMGYLIQKRELKKVGAWREKPKGQGFFNKAKKGKLYTCYNDGTPYKGDRCPKCGARGGRISFE